MDKKVSYTTIDEYCAQFPPEVQEMLASLRKQLQQSAPAATEAIAYGIPTLKLNGNLVHFAAYEHHLGFYPGTEAIEVFKKDLTDYTTSKGTIQFPLDKPLPFDIIKRITEFRVKKISQKGK